MSVLIVSGILFGTILGRFFKIFILVPSSALAVIVVLASPALPDHSLWTSALEIAVLVTSLQIGYVVGLVTSNTSGSLEGTSKFWGNRAPTTVSRSYHVR